jgi:poly(ADP-ribose) glycohydrolase
MPPWTSNAYHLPSHPSQTCIDRFSIIDSDEPYVSTWSVLTALLARPLDTHQDLFDLLDTILLTLGCPRGPEYDSLERALDEYSEISTTVHSSGPDTERTTFLDAWPRLRDLALALPSLFADGTLPILSRNAASATLSRRQVACLLVHMFLGTIPAQPWASASGGEAGAVGFGIWYTSDQAVPHAADAYLRALMAYFASIAKCTDDDDHWSQALRYDLVVGDLPSIKDGPFLPFTSIDVLNTFTTASPFLGLPGGAAVVMSNRHVGFGVSGTQEEIHVGSSPEACIVSLLCPPLAADEVLAVRGAIATVEIEGYGRGTRLGRVLPRANEREWEERTMLFMDALELDVHDASSGLPDLAPGNVRRELRKAYIAFASSADPYTHVLTGLWGCGAFGGDPEVKTVVQWCAAALAGLPLRMVLGSEQSTFAHRLKEFEQAVMERGATIQAVVEIMEDLRHGVGAGGLFASILDQLSGDL